MPARGVRPHGRWVTFLLVDGTLVGCPGPPDDHVFAGWRLLLAPFEQALHLIQRPAGPMPATS